MSENNQSLEEILFDLAVQKPEATERGAFLDNVCRDNPALRAQLDELLEVHFGRAGFLPKPAAGGPLPATLRFIAPAEAPAQMLGRYKLLERIGEGGFGEVWMAEQREPVKRRVALKIIKLGMDSRQIVARFEAERQALAMMDHANIAKIFDADVSDTGRPYFVMELVRGIKITEYCDQNQLTTKDRLDLFIKVCQAIQHAHQKGVIHRDIKPSNILVTLHDGVPVPKVIDFGIAKATQQELTDKTFFTQFQQFIGTPAYISPEQAEMSGLDIDTRADIYSLGVLLYELLVGQTPFDAAEMMKGGIEALRQIIREREPLRPSTKLNTLPGDARTTAGKRRQVDFGKLVHQLQGDLDWIVMKCLEKDRARRYETANGLAADLKRHLNNEPVVARPPSAAYRFQKAFRRNKLMFGAGMAVASALLVGIAASLWQAARATRAKIQADASSQAAQDSEQKARKAEAGQTLLREQAEIQELAAHRRAYASEMSLAQQSLVNENLGRALELLNRQRPAKDSEIDLRGWEWRYLWQRCRGDMKSTLYQQAMVVYYAGFLSDGTRVATFDAAGKVNLWDVDTRAEVVRLQDHVPGVNEISNSGQANLSNDGELLAASSRAENGQPSVKVWKTSTGEVMAEFPGDGSLVTSLRFSPDKQKLAAFTLNTAVGVWNIATKELKLRISVAQGNTLSVGSVAFSPDGALLAIGEGDGGVRLVDVATGMETAEFRASKDGIMTLAFSPDGHVLAAGAAFFDPIIRLWDVPNKKKLPDLDGHQGFIASLTFSPDGKTLASASGDATIKLWNTTTWKEEGTLLGHADEVWSVAFSRDGKRLVSAGKDGAVNIWPTSQKRSSQEVLSVPAVERDWDASPNGAALAVAGREGIICLWDAVSGENKMPLPALGTNNVAVFWSPAGEILAGSREPPEIRIWNLANATLTTHSLNLGGSPRSWLFLPKTGRILIGANSGLTNWTLSRWDIRTRSEVSTLTLNKNIRGLTVSADEHLLVIGTYQGDVLLLNLETGQQEASFKAHTEMVQGLALLPDGKFLVTAGTEGPIVKVWDLANRKAMTLPRAHHLLIRSIVISPDGSRMATTPIGREPIKIWDTKSWEELATLGVDGTTLARLRFLPDGNTLATTDANQTLHLWRAPSWEEIAAAEAKEKTEIKQP